MNIYFIIYDAGAKAPPGFDAHIRAGYESLFKSIISRLPEDLHSILLSICLHGYCATFISPYNTHS